MIANFHHGLVRKAPPSILHGLVAKSSLPKSKGLTHPSGKVTGIDQETNLPIVDRSQPSVTSKVERKSSPAHPHATATPVVSMTPEAMRAGHATAQHPAMRTAMEEATNQHLRVGKEDGESKRTVVQPTDNPAINQALATAAMPEFEKRIKEAIAGIPGAHLAATRDYKNPKRLGEKINGEDQPAETVGDYGAAQISVDSIESKDAVLSAVKKEFPIAKEKDMFDKGDDDYHFYHISLQVQMPNHATIELQIVPKEVLDANPDQHHDYKAAREAKISGNEAEFAKQAAQGKAKNDKAMAAFNARNETSAKYKFGSTQANLSPNSEAARAISAAQKTIPDEHLGGDGKDIDKPHVTIRYGVKGANLEGLRNYIRKQPPFDATLGKTSSFPPSENSDGAAVIKADVHSPDLHRMNAEISKHADFAPSSFREYKPHVTVAYVKPEHAKKHVGNLITEGKKFHISSVHISDRDGNKEEIPLGVGNKSDQQNGGRGESPERVTGGSPMATPVASLKKGDAVRLKDGQRATVAYVPPKNASVAVYRMVINGGKSITLRAKDVDRGAAKKIGGEGRGVIAVDLDSTLAKFTKFKGPTVIGQPIPDMVEHVKKWLAEGEDVQIFTARVGDDKSGTARKAIEDWCQKHIGEVLPITNIKTPQMKIFYDDRAVQVGRNTGELLGKPEEVLA